MSEAGGTEAKISLGKTAVEHGRVVAPSDAINLSKVVTDKVLLEKLEKYGTINTANLWLPVAFAQIIGHFGETDLLHTLARHLSTKSSPFRPWYEVHHDYQIKVDSESSDCCKAMFSVDMKLPAGSLSSSASLVLPLEQFSDWNEEKVEKIRDSLLASVVGMRCQTSPTNLGEKDLCKPVKVPLVTEMLALLEKPTKGSLDLRLSEVIIRRYGLLSGRVDTLDHIAKDVDTSKDISRERVRQLEEKALKLIHSRKRVRRELSSCFNAFKSQIQLWLSAHNHVGHVQEIVDDFKDYIDFDKYEFGSAMLFLCDIAGFFVEISHHDTSNGLVSTSESHYRAFANGYKIVTNSNIDETSDEVILLKGVKETRLVVRSTDIDNVEAVRSMASEVVGPPKVMRYDDFLHCIMRLYPFNEELAAVFRQADPCHPNSNDASRRLVCNLAAVSFVSAAEYERMAFGTWITCGLTERAQDIVHAIIYSGANEGLPGCQIDPRIGLRQGVSSGQIVAFLASRTGYEMAEQALDELCRRSPDVFVRTGPRSWGSLVLEQFLVMCGKNN